MLTLEDGVFLELRRLEASISDLYHRLGSGSPCRCLSPPVFGRGTMDILRENPLEIHIHSPFNELSPMMRSGSATLPILFSRNRFLKRLGCNLAILFLHHSFLRLLVPTCIIALPSSRASSAVNIPVAFVVPTGMLVVGPPLRRVSPLGHPKMPPKAGQV